MFIIQGNPPSVNHYWLASGHRRFISKEGREYKRIFALQAPRLKEKIKEPVEVRIHWVRPDNRRRDIDNILKVSLDCLTENILEDDSLIYKLTIDKSLPIDKSNPHLSIEIVFNTV